MRYRWRGGGGGLADKDRLGFAGHFVEICFHLAVIEKGEGFGLAVGFDYASMASFESDFVGFHIDFFSVYG